MLKSGKENMKKKESEVKEEKIKENVEKAWDEKNIWILERSKMMGRELWRRRKKKEKKKKEKGKESIEKKWDRNEFEWQKKKKKNRL